MDTELPVQVNNDGATMRPEDRSYQTGISLKLVNSTKKIEANQIAGSSSQG
jgi:hypothetical protein